MQLLYFVKHIPVYLLCYIAKIRTLHIINDLIPDEENDGNSH